MDEPEVGDKFRSRAAGRTVTVIDRPDPEHVVYAVGRVSRYSIGQERTIEQWQEMVTQYRKLPSRAASVPSMVLHVQRHPEG